MRPAALAIFLLILVVCDLAPQTAQGKGFGIIVTGGDLGDFAYPFGITTDDESSLTETDAIPAPDPVPPLAYDLYNFWGNFSVVFQKNSGGPELRYYPEPRLLNRTGDAIWLKVTDRGAAVLDGAISEALAKRARGELEVDADIAQFRAVGMLDASYYAFSHAPASPRTTIKPSMAAYDPQGFYDPGKLLNVDGPVVRLTSNGAEFIRNDVMPILEGKPIRAPVAAAFAISYLTPAQGPPGGAGFFGYYASPDGGHPGRFWPDDAGYFGDSKPYFETTPQFDAFVRSAVQEIQSSVAPSRREDSSVPVPAVALAVGALIALFTFGLAAVRRHRSRTG